MLETSKKHSYNFQIRLKGGESEITIIGIKLIRICIIQLLVSAITISLNTAYSLYNRHVSLIFWPFLYLFLIANGFAAATRKSFSTILLYIIGSVLALLWTIGFAVMYIALFVMLQSCKSIDTCLVLNGDVMVAKGLALGTLITSILEFILMIYSTFLANCLRKRIQKEESFAYENVVSSSLVTRDLSKFCETNATPIQSAGNPIKVSDCTLSTV